jgi:hypothetical protein
MKKTQKELLTMIYREKRILKWKGQTVLAIRGPNWTGGCWMELVEKEAHKATNF